MKKLIPLLMLCILAEVINAQEENISTKFGMGLQLNQYQKEFGIGLNLTSPYFVNNKIAVRLRGNLMFHDYVKNAETTWTPYSNISLGLIGVAREVGDFMRLYGEGGVIFLLPSDEFSSDNFVAGGYGLFGFEFYIISKLNYFIEVGGLGTGAKADKVINKPIYSNGILISAGIRAHF